MSIPGAGNPLLLGGAAGAAYKIERSLRFNSADSAYLSRTPVSTSNRKTWTWSGWVKRGNIANRGAFFAACNAGATVYTIGEFDATGCIRVLDSGVITGSDQGARTTTAIFRDPSAWYHIVLVYDTPNAIDSDRIRLYVNGSRITSFSEERSVTQNLDSQVNLNTQLHSISRYAAYDARYHDGYLADVHFIDGQALTPSSFGETDINGVWQPKAYSGTYGTNGFQLKFADNSAATATTLGKDTSGNGNNWTPNNFSVTAGAGNDSLVDSPTNYGTDTGAGGEVRGNYCTWNPLDKGADLVLSNGNLDATIAVANWRTVRASFGVSSGKWYWEITNVSASASDYTIIGIATKDKDLSFNMAGGDTATDKSVNYLTGLSQNDVVACALNMDAGTLQLYLNNVSNGPLFTGITGTWFPAISLYPAGYVSANFGQRPFAYTAPSGFKALCTQNLPTPTITKPSTVMDALTWTGTSANQTVSGLNFNPDLIWIKIRSDAKNHAIQDSVRGFTTLSKLSSSGTFAEGDTSNMPDWAGYVNGATSTGFTLTKNGTGADDWVHTNKTGNTYVGWCWDAGSTTVTNTSGTISSQVRANASAGFSIATITQPSSGSFSVGHGLGVAPSFFIYKVRGATSNWGVWHQSLTGGTYYLLLNTAGAQVNDSTVWSSSPTSSVVNIGSGWTAAGAVGAVLYSFAPVAGYSAFGSYTGNGSADGPFVYTGFRPRWLMIKSSSAPYGWVIHDTLREPYNVDDSLIYANTAGAEATDSVSWGIDILSNGFKIRTSAGVVWNNSGSTFIYAAFAESPFALARAR